MSAKGHPPQGQQSADPRNRLNVTELLELFGVAREEAGREPFIVSNDGNLLPPYRQDNNNDFTFRDSP